MAKIKCPFCEAEFNKQINDLEGSDKFVPLFEDELPDFDSPEYKRLSKELEDERNKLNEFNYATFSKNESNCVSPCEEFDTPDKE